MNITGIISFILTIALTLFIMILVLKELFTSQQQIEYEKAMQSQRPKNIQRAKRAKKPIKKIPYKKLTPDKKNSQINFKCLHNQKKPQKSSNSIIKSNLKF